jgi:1-phosphatidylinositol phosphodiesterase
VRSHMLKRTLETSASLQDSKSQLAGKTRRTFSLFLFTRALAICLVCLSASASTNSAWMGSLDGNKTLAEFSIPGSHDSGALYELISGTAKCQNLTIGEQLNAGVRYLDIRCRHVKDAFDIYHGAAGQHLNFDEVLDACTGFLKTNPTECIIMSVKEEYKPADNTRAFEQTFDAYLAKHPDAWLLTGGIPTLNQARGKIVLLRRFEAKKAPKGIAATNWADSRTFEINNGATRIKIQDEYVVSDNEAKWRAIHGLYEEAAGTNTTSLYINFTSGTHPGPLGISTVPPVSDFMNPAVAAYFSGKKSGRFGISVMDFVDEKRCGLIIATNH